MLDDIFAPFQQVLFEIAGAPTTLAEVLGFVTGALCVWLVVKQNVWTFPIGIANNVFFGLLFYDAGLYADAGLQVVYMALGAFGWWAWLRLGPGHTELRVSRSVKALLAGVVAVLVITAVLVPVLTAVNGSAPFLDANTTALSLTAQALLSFKKIENWYFWIVADIIYIPLYISKGLVLTGIVYVLFLCMCVAGYVQWRRALIGAPPRDDASGPGGDVRAHDAQGGAAVEAGPTPPVVPAGLRA